MENSESKSSRLENLRQAHRRLHPSYDNHLDEEEISQPAPQKSESQKLHEIDFHKLSLENSLQSKEEQDLFSDNLLNRDSLGLAVERSLP